MKIIAFGDIHMATSALSSIKDLAEADAVIATGDLTNFGDSGDAKVVLNQILEYNKNLLCLAGNLDNSDVNDYLENLGMNLHGQARIIKRKVCIYGVGGSNRTPYNTLWEFSEDEIFKLVAEAHHQAVELIDLAEPLTGYRIPSIFVSHAPPRNTKVDIQHDGAHVGSQAIRRFIENNSPDLCITGHIHESRGQDYVGNTLVINPGMLAKGGWVEVEVDKNTVNATLQ